MQSCVVQIIRCSATLVHRLHVHGYVSVNHVQPCKPSLLCIFPKRTAACPVSPSLPHAAAQQAQAPAPGTRPGCGCCPVPASFHWQPRPLLATQSVRQPWERLFFFSMCLTMSTSRSEPLLPVPRELQGDVLQPIKLRIHTAWCGPCGFRPDPESLMIDRDTDAQRVRVRRHRCCMLP
jgi:hypothetical protein